MWGAFGAGVLAIIDPGQGTAPPGSGQLTTLVSYVAWGVTVLCVVGASTGVVPARLRQEW